MDSFRGFVFERFVSWIRFMKTKIPNYSIRFGRIRVRIPHPLFLPNVWFLFIQLFVFRKKAILPRTGTSSGTRPRRTSRTLGSTTSTGSR